MYCGNARLCVCLCVCVSAAVCPHYCIDPDVTWGRGRGCPLVVHYWADLQSVHGLRCYGNITRTLVACLRHSANARRGVRALLASDWRVTGSVLKIARCIWEVAVAGLPVTCRRRGAFSTLLRRPGLRLPLMAFWQHNANENVSEYMLVLALYLVDIFNRTCNEISI